MTNSYPRESSEFQPVEVTVDGVVTVDDVEFQITELGARPSGTWIAPVVLGGKIGVTVESMSPGTYVVWAKVTTLAEAPVVNCGNFVVT